jgi:hypothetical protein
VKISSGRTIKKVGPEGPPNLKEGRKRKEKEKKGKRCKDF